MADRLRLGLKHRRPQCRERLRNALSRRAALPDPVRAARVAQEAGADGITAHLREDRRHIRDADVDAIMAAITIPLNFEMAATDEMQRIALAHRPHAACIVPERREERTTEGGLEVAGDDNRLAAYIAPLRDAGIRAVAFHRRPTLLRLRPAIRPHRRAGGSNCTRAPICDFHAPTANYWAARDDGTGPAWSRGRRRARRAPQARGAYRAMGLPD